MGEKCTRQLPPLRVSETLEVALLRLAAAQERTLSEYIKLVDSRHADVCRTIERLIEKGVVGGCAPSAYTHEQNGQPKMVEVTPKGLTKLATALAMN